MNLSKSSSIFSEKSLIATSYFKERITNKTLIQKSSIISRYNKLIGSTELGMILTLLTGGRGCGNSSSVHQSFMCCNPAKEVWFGVEIIRVPDPFGK
jgi:hypothetical protein